MSSLVPPSVPPRRVALPVVPASSLGIDGRRNTVYPADVTGRFARGRRAAFVVLIGIYGALPWIPVGGRPALFLDLVRRQFFLFGHVFNAQDTWRMVFLLTGGAFALVVTTSVAGRVWCGWACPQTVFLEGLYRPVERFVEGPRERRIRRAHGPWTWDKLWRRTLVHAVWVILSLALAHALLAYFVSVAQVMRVVRQAPATHPEAFVVTFGLAAVLYFNFAWFREQFCVVLCPYGRLQSVLLDADSLVVGYDPTRGEPRGKATQAGSGDCVDCRRCVVVCPTGIDIRNGLQMDCVACTACIDACDDVMDRLGRHRGLVRYDSQNGLAGLPRRFLRPRLAVYAGLGLAGLLAAAFAFQGRPPFEANLLRVVGAPYTLEDGLVRNAFRVHIVNKGNMTSTFTLEPEVTPGVGYVVAPQAIELAPLAGAEVSVVVTVPRSGYRGDFPARVRVQGPTAQVEVTAPFLGPTASRP